MHATLRPAVHSRSLVLPDPQVSRCLTPVCSGGLWGDYRGYTAADRKDCLNRRVEENRTQSLDRVDPERIRAYAVRTEVPDDCDWDVRNPTAHAPPYLPILERTHHGRESRPVRTRAMRCPMRCPSSVASRMGRCRTTPSRAPSPTVGSRIFCPLDLLLPIGPASVNLVARVPRCLIFGMIWRGWGGGD